MTSSRAWALEGGRFCEGGAIPLTDRGFRYGMSVFETFAVRHGRLLFRDAHLARLCRACEAAAFAFPHDLGDAMAPLDFSTFPEGVLRVYVTAGDGAPCATGESRTFALFDAADLSSAPLRVSISRAPLPIILGGWKTGNYWPHVQALSEARREGFDEALAFNAVGQLVSAAMANVFIVSGGVVRTPALECGARDGVVREWVRSQVFAEETILSLEDIEKADECFLTNSRIGVAPVPVIDGRTLPDGAIGKSLAQLYRETVLGI